MSDDKKTLMEKHNITENIYNELEMLYKDLIITSRWVLESEGTEQRVVKEKLDSLLLFINDQSTLEYVSRNDKILLIKCIGKSYKDNLTVKENSLLSNVYIETENKYLRKFGANVLEFDELPVDIQIINSIK